MPTISYQKIHHIILLLAISIIGGASLIAQPLKGVRICIDPGHGGHDPSNDRRVPLPHGQVYWESEGNLTTALHVQRLLEELGATVRLTRNRNEDSDDISLSSRSAIANAFGADYFHSIHTNAGGGNYSLVLYKESGGSPAWSDAKSMGDLMAPRLEHLLKTTGHYNRGDKSFLGFNLGVLRNTDMPATLSEGAFHDIPAEGLRLKNNAYLENYAWAIVQSFCRYFNASCFETARIGGIATDRATGTPINNVKVTVSPSGKIYTGDEGFNGFYALGGLQEGPQTLLFERSGYLDLERKVTLLANQYTDLDISMIPDDNGRPFADFKIKGLPAGALDSLTFDASASADDGQIVGYIWDLGDGSSDTGRIVRHAYAQDGHYLITLTVKDDNGLTSSLTKSLDIITEVPAAPTLIALLWNATHDSLQVSWKPGSGVPAYGYRLELKPAGSTDDYRIYADENQLIGGSRQGWISADGISPNTLYLARLVAVNRSGAESGAGDIYSIFRSGLRDSKEILIVDGFDRRASYGQATHSFNTVYSGGITALTHQINISSVSNEAIYQSKLSLSRYEMVLWLLGDESTKDETFSPQEQQQVAAYLKNGGKLFITGSEIGWDLDKKGNATDKLFYKTYFKAQFVSDGEVSLTPAHGLPGTLWKGQTLHFGVVYPEDYPDVLQPIGGSKGILKYSDGTTAGLSYSGRYAGTKTAKLIYIGFPLETVAKKSEIKAFLRGVLDFFGIPFMLTQSRDIKMVNPICKLLQNPFRYTLSLDIETHGPTPLQLVISGINGRIFWENIFLSKEHQTLSIPTSFWPNGSYIIYIVDPYGRKTTLRAIKI